MSARTAWTLSERLAARKECQHACTAARGDGYVVCWDCSAVFLSDTVSPAA